MCCDLNCSSKPENRSANGNITSSFDMALSLLQDAQTRGLAAAFAGMRREEVERNMSMSPSVSASTSSNILYPGLQQAAAASALGIISPHLLAANRQAAAAFMASQMPMSSTMAANVASTLFQPHSALFGSWSSSQIAPHVILGNGGAPHSPPVSPHSPLSVNHGQYQKHGLTPPKATNSNNSSTSSCEAPPKKARKISVKKEMVSPPIEISMNVGDLYTTSGPISPPSSGSSPNSTHDIQNNNNSNNNNNKDASRDKSFTCTICSRSFGYKHVLQNHERTHTGEKPFECPECHKRFTRDHHLKTHMRLHTGEKPYHCSHCDRQFVQVANLRRHLRVHTGERPYTCEICEGKFSDSNQLKSHMLVHNSEKPFECETCHAKFRRRHHVLNHKCRVQSPPTPAISPSVSEYPVCDQKSTVSHCDGSEESIDRSSVLEAPLDLSEEATSNTSGGTDGNRNRKPHDIRRVFRLPPQIALVISNLPEQTEPEDLSLRSSRDDFILQSPVSLHHDDIDLDELDDAASLYLRHQRLKTALSCNK